MLCDNNMLRGILLAITIIVFTSADFVAPNHGFAAQKSSKAKKHSKNSKKAKRTGSRKANTHYNFRARTYYPWYEGYSGFESFYMQFDRRYGY